jgi:hypothetical protein
MWTIAISISHVATHDPLFPKLILFIESKHSQFSYPRLSWEGKNWINAQSDFSPREFLELDRL